MYSYLQRRLRPHPLLHQLGPPRPPHHCRQTPTGPVHLAPNASRSLFEKIIRYSKESKQVNSVTFKVIQNMNRVMNNVEKRFKKNKDGNKNIIAGENNTYQDRSS